MKWKAYPGYKPSGLEWLGGIPEDWEIFPVKHLAGNHVDVVQTGPFGAQLHASDYVDEGVPLILIRNVNNSVIDTSDIPKISEEKANSLGMYRLKEGDIVFSRVGSIGRIALITKKETGWLISGQMLRLRINNPILDKIFSIYAFSCDEVLKFVQLQSVGSTRESINTDILRNMPIPIPSLREQRSIAAFLDRETGRIDALVEKKQRQIELLQEKRAALISRAVTKGLDPTVPLKDSEVEWLCQIPAHWEIMKLKYLVEGGLINGLFKKKEFFGSGVKLVNVFDVYRKDFLIDHTSLDLVEADQVEQSKYAVRSGDIFFVRSSLKLEGVGRSVCALDIGEPTVFECHVVRGRPIQQKISPKFLIHFLNSIYVINRFISLANLVTMATIDQDKIKSLEVSLPPRDEQDKIMAFLDRETETMEKLEKSITKSIEKLKEYRTGLISAAVTGRIDVRETGT